MTTQPNQSTDVAEIYPENQVTADEVLELGAQIPEVKEEVPSIDKTVNEIISNSKGKDLIFPEGISEELKFAVMAEKRRRDTQAEYTKAQQKAKKLEELRNKEKEKLLQSATDNVKITLTAEEQEKLNTLKHSNPDAWREAMNELEFKAKERAKEELNKNLSKITEEDTKAETREERKQIMLDFYEANPGFKFTKDSIEKVPGIFETQVAKGEITFMEYLYKAKEFIEAYNNISIGDGQTQPEMHNLSKAGGGSSLVAGQQKSSKYEDTIF